MNIRKFTNERNQVESPIGDIVNIYDDNLLLQKWLIGHKSNLIYSRDDAIQGAKVFVAEIKSNLL